MKWDCQLQKLRNTMAQLLKKYKIDKAVNQYRAINMWKEIVGETIAEKSRPTAIKNGKMFVYVKSSVWRNELIFHRERIIQNLNERLGQDTIQEIIFR